MHQLTEEQQSLLLELGYFVLNSTDPVMKLAFANNADVSDEVLEDLRSALRYLDGSAEVRPCDTEARARGYFWTVWHYGKKHSNYKVKRMASDAASYLNGTRKRKPKDMV